MELVLTIANPTREIKSSVEDDIRGEVGGVVGLEILLSESLLLLNSDALVYVALLMLMPMHTL